MADLRDDDLKAIIEDANGFFADSKNRERALGVPASELKARLSSFALANGMDPKALIKSVITIIEL